MKSPSMNTVTIWGPTVSSDSHLDSNPMMSPRLIPNDDVKPITSLIPTAGLIPGGLSWQQKIFALLVEHLYNSVYTLLLSSVSFPIQPDFHMLLSLWILVLPVLCIWFSSLSL